MVRGSGSLIKSNCITTLSLQNANRNRRPVSAMSSSSSNPLNPEAAALRVRQSKSPAFKFLVPLVYAPVLPLIRLTLRHKPVLRDRLFIGVLVGAFAHGSYLVSDLYNSESK